MNHLLNYSQLRNRFFVMRHGESEANILEVISNRGSVHGLTEKGRRQATQLADRLQDEALLLTNVSIIDI